MSDGSIVAYEPTRGWYFLRTAPTSAPAIVVEQQAAQPPVIEQQVIYEPAAVVEQAPAPEAAQPEQPPTDWYDLSTMPTAAPEIVAACATSRAVWCH
ncbi:MAG TPA: hypothetical protein VFX76_09440 [Roseiflexaceae bacterium]|nr:hypothetical protein [Roseiflexaceae bacterium]